MYPYFNQQYVPGWNQIQPQQAGQQPQPVIMRQLLTPDQKQLLKENGSARDGFFTPISPVEGAANMCTHKFDNGVFALTEPDSEGFRTCQVCHTKFRLVEPDEITQQEVMDLCNKMLDLTESIKLYKGDIDPEVGAMVYQMSSIIRRFPGMWKNASEYIKRAVSPQYAYNMYQNRPSPLSTFNMVYQGVNPYYNPAFFQQQPVVGVQPVQTPVAPQPQAQPVAQQYIQPIVQQPYAQGVPYQVVPQTGYTPVAPLTPVVSAPIPGQVMSNPIGYTVQGQQVVAPTATAAPTAAPVTGQTVVVATPEEAKK